MFLLYDFSFAPAIPPGRVLDSKQIDKVISHSLRLVQQVYPHFEADFEMRKRKQGDIDQQRKKESAKYQNPHFGCDIVYYHFRKLNRGGSWFFLNIVAKIVTS